MVRTLFTYSNNLTICLKEKKGGFIMRDLTKTGFNSNSPLRNFVQLSEKIEALECRNRQLEQTLIDATVRITAVENQRKSGIHI